MVSRTRHAYSKSWASNIRASILLPQNLADALLTLNACHILHPGAAGLGMYAQDTHRSPSEVIISDVCRRERHRGFVPTIMRKVSNLIFS